MKNVAEKLQRNPKYDYFDKEAVTYAKWCLELHNVRLSLKQVMAIVHKMMELYEIREEASANILANYQTMMAAFPAFIAIGGLEDLIANYKYPRMPVPADFKFQQNWLLWLEVIKLATLVEEHSEQAHQVQE